ncbi:GPN-loop GTPase 3 [Tupaia chinensis]|uniref:GPN-loop GTPase 3 n=1 Tax=Tupaia chinensis TaxID=246437 RepID=L9L2X8_TUPCH|nr:GPN-loop GTPase 3 [Tupaia chinensis]
MRWRVTLRPGPQGGLVLCVEYFANHSDRLENCVGHLEDDYTLFDCPGQMELHTPRPVMKQLVQQLAQWAFRDWLLCSPTGGFVSPPGGEA